MWEQNIKVDLVHSDQAVCFLCLWRLNLLKYGEPIQLNKFIKLIETLLEI